MTNAEWIRSLDDSTLAYVLGVFYEKGAENYSKEADSLRLYDFDDEFEWLKAEVLQECT